MKWTKILTLAWLSLFLLTGHTAPKPVMVVPVTGAIGPASADFVSRGVARAIASDAQLLILKMDTPGGLDTSMRQIIKDILSSPVPVAVFVAPSGARAASAGTYILYASHIAAMAPGTNLGAATPVQVGMGQSDAPARPAKEDKQEKGDKQGQAKPADTRSDMSKKQVNDAAAYIRGLAQMRGRNADWAELAVREAVSLSAVEAREQDVIDLVATDVPNLLNQLDGWRISMPSGERVLNTANAPVVTIEVDWKTKLLATITDPSVALILMMIGVYGLFFEFYNPGMVLPGVAGAISLLLALFAFHLLPINYAGLALMGLGLAFMVAEAFLPSFGVLGIGGAVAFGFGAVMLIDTEVPGFGIPLSLIVGLAITSALFVFFIVAMALKARKQPVVTGQEQLIGTQGIALEDIQNEGWVQIYGEHWRAQSPSPVVRGQKIKVTGRVGLMLSIVPLDEVKRGE